MRPQQVIKRDGTPVPFEAARIAAAIASALQAVGADDPDAAEELALTVQEHLERCQDQPQVGIEAIQDAVVHVLQESGYYQAAIAYTRYRDARERARRDARSRGQPAPAPNLHLVDGDGRRRPWERAELARLLGERAGLDAKAAGEAVLGVEELLAGSDLTELSAPLFDSLVDAALVRAGRHSDAGARAALRVERAGVRADLAAGDGRSALEAAGRRTLRQLALAEDYPPEVVRQWCRGRLWVGGLDDPRRGCQYTWVSDGPANPWMVLAHAFATATAAAGSWRRVRVVLPPAILGHLERGAHQLVAPLAALAGVAQVLLYCDGRTPLLAQWPFAGKAIGLATYQEDFLLLHRTQELGMPAVSGPQYSVPGWRQAVAAELALNAQGLDGEFSQLDALAFALVAAARVRLRQLGPLAGSDGAELRFAVFGLAQRSESGQYLERQVQQEGLRCGLRLVRSANLSEAACTHLGRLLE